MGGVQDWVIEGEAQQAQGTWCSAWLSLLSPEKHAGCSAPSSRPLTALTSLALRARAPRFARGAGVVGTWCPPRQHDLRHPAPETVPHCTTLQRCCLQKQSAW